MKLAGLGFPVVVDYVCRDCGGTFKTTLPYWVCRPAPHPRQLPRRCLKCWNARRTARQTEVA
jgi:hypothetical protein